MRIARCRLPHIVRLWLRGSCKYTLNLNAHRRFLKRLERVIVDVSHSCENYQRRTKHRSSLLHLITRSKSRREVLFFIEYTISMQDSHGSSEEGSERQIQVRRFRFG